MKTFRFQCGGIPPKYIGPFPDDVLFQLGGANSCASRITEVYFPGLSRSPFFRRAVTEASTSTLFELIFTTGIQGCHQTCILAVWLKTIVFLLRTDHPELI